MLLEFKLKGKKLKKKKQCNLKFFKKTLKYVWDWNTQKKKYDDIQKTKLSTQSYVKCMIWHTTCYLLMFDDNTQEMCGIINKLYEEK